MAAPLTTPSASTAKSSAKPIESAVVAAAKIERQPERVSVVRVGEQPDEIVEADELL